LVAALCGVAADRAGLVGIAWAPDGRPAVGLTIRASWATERGPPRAARSEVGPRGLYAICDLPAEVEVTVRLRNGREQLLERVVRLSQNEFRWFELRPFPEGPPM
jgi:hypothetical protein